jgi:hypothetical protein
MDLEVSASDKRIEVTLIGERLDDKTLRRIQSGLHGAGLGGTTLVVHQAGSKDLDVTSLRAGILSDLYRDTQRELDQRDARIESLQQELVKQQQSYEAATPAWLTAAADIERELKAQLPAAEDVVIGAGVAAGTSVAEPVPVAGAQSMVAILSVRVSEPLSPEDTARLEAWFLARSKARTARVFVAAPPPPPPPPTHAARRSRK